MVPHEDPQSEVVRNQIALKWIERPSTNSTQLGVFPCELSGVRTLTLTFPYGVFFKKWKKRKRGIGGKRGRERKIE